MKRSKLALLILLGVGIVGLVFSAGYAVGAYPLGHLFDKHVTPTTHPSESVPTQYEDSPQPNINQVTATFNRPQENTTIFSDLTHDPMLVRDDNTTFLIVGTGSGQELYRSTTPENPNSWTLADGDYLTDDYEFDSIINRNGTFIAYGNGDVYTTTDIAADDWTRVNRRTGFRDLGAYYDKSTGLVHLYYERGDAAGGLSGKHIGHAVSPNGITNWTVYPPVWTAPDGYGVGDFDIVNENGTLFILGDYDTHHPRYNVSVWVNTNPYSSFQQLDTPAMSYRSGETPFADDYGVGDPTVLQLEDGRYLMIANGYASKTADSALQSYIGIITTNATEGRVGIEPTYDTG